MAKQKLLFVTTELPWPADSGGRIKSFRLLEFLSKHYEVRVLCAQGESNEEGLKKLPEATGIRSVQAFNNHRKRSVINWMEALMRFPTFNAFRVYSKAFESMLRWGVESADIVLIDHLEMLEMVDVKQLHKVAFHSHNAEFLLWKRYAEMSSNPMVKSGASLESARIKTFERWAIRNTAMTFAAPNDQAAWKHAMDIPAEKLKLTYHLGDEAMLQLPAPDVLNNKPKVIFAGTLSWMPNQDGLQWLLRSVWPEVKKRVQNAELIICGKGAPTALISEMNQCNGVTYLGFVDDLAATMAECAAAVVPMRVGAGMKIKTLDALYRGLPLVSTSIGTEGIDLEDGVHAWIADTKMEMIEALTTALTDRNAAVQRAENGRRLAAERYTYDRIFTSMLSDLKAGFPEPH